MALLEIGAGFLLPVLIIKLWFLPADNCKRWGENIWGHWGVNIQSLEKSQHMEEGNFTGWVFHVSNFNLRTVNDWHLAKNLYSLWPKEPKDRVWDNQKYKVSEDSRKEKAREWTQSLCKYSAKISCWILNHIWARQTQSNPVKGKRTDLGVELIPKRPTL